MRVPWGMILNSWWTDDFKNHRRVLFCKQSCSVSKKTQQLQEGRFGLTKYVPQQPSTIITAKAKSDIAHLPSIPVFVAVVNVRPYVSLLTEQLCSQECSFPWDNYPLWHTWTLSGLFHTYKLYQEENTPFQIARLFFITNYILIIE